MLLLTKQNLEKLTRVNIMNYQTAENLLNNAFYGVYNHDEKLLLEKMLKVSKKGSKTLLILKDLLTNDFYCDNCGYFMSNLRDLIDGKYNAIYTKKNIISLAKLLKR